MAIYLGGNCITYNNSIGIKHINIIDDEAIILRTLSTYENFTTTQIASYTFAECKNLSEVNLPNIKDINTGAFYSCTGLISINMPQVKTINDEAFKYCSNLTIADFPVCTSIGSIAFLSCNSLTTINFPVCTYIGSFAFGQCYNLLSLYLTSISSVPTLGVSAFVSTPIGGYTTSTDGVYGSVYVPASLYNSFLTATNWSLISSRIVSI